MYEMQQADVCRKSIDQKAAFIERAISSGVLQNDNEKKVKRLWRFQRFIKRNRYFLWTAISLETRRSDTGKLVCETS